MYVMKSGEAPTFFNVSQASKNLFFSIRGSKDLEDDLACLHHPSTSSRDRDAFAHSVAPYSRLCSGLAFLFKTVGRKRAVSDVETLSLSLSVNILLLESIRR